MPSSSNGVTAELFGGPYDGHKLWLPLNALGEPPPEFYFKPDDPYKTYWSDINHRPTDPNIILYTAGDDATRSVSEPPLRYYYVPLQLV